MINLAAFIKHDIKIFFFIAGSTLLLQACGGQRDEPFDAGSESSSGAKVAVDLLLSEDKVLIARQDGKHFTIMTTTKELTDVWDAYTQTQLNLSQADMNTGQALLYDAGEVGSCPQKLTFTSYYANETSENSVTIFLEFNDADKKSIASSASSLSSTSSVISSNSLSSSSSSACPSIQLSRPFKIFYIHSREKLLIKEVVK